MTNTWTRVATSRSSDPAVGDRRSLGAISQNHFEQLLSAYTSPPVDIRYDLLDYRGRSLGRLEVFRDRRKLPYSVRKDILGMKRHIKAGQVFVRHGSQVAEAALDEKQALIDEGTRARAAS